MPIEAEAFANFHAALPFDLDWHGPWLDTMDQVIRAGRAVQRVRVMDEPPTPYRRFEVAVTPHNLAVGEDIRILSAMAHMLDRSGQEFCLFDQARIVVTQFDADGVFQAAEVSDNPPRVAAHRAARDRALGQATPYSEYMAAHPGGADV